MHNISLYFAISVVFAASELTLAEIDKEVKGKSIVIFTKENDENSTIMKNSLQKNNVPYVEFNIDESKNAYQYMINNNLDTSSPKVFYCGTYGGGVTELINSLCTLAEKHNTPPLPKKCLSTVPKGSQEYVIPNLDKIQKECEQKQMNNANQPQTCTPGQNGNNPSGGGTRPNYNDPNNKGNTPDGAATKPSPPNPEKPNENKPNENKPSPNTPPENTPKDSTKPNTPATPTDTNNKNTGNSGSGSYDLNVNSSSSHNSASQSAAFNQNSANYSGNGYSGSASSASYAAKAASSSSSSRMNAQAKGVYKF